MQATHLSDTERHHGSVSSPDASRCYSGNYEGASGSVKSDKIVFSQKPVYNGKPRYNGSSTNSSPTADRQRFNIKSPNWRRDAFVQESTTQPDPFFTQNGSGSSAHGEPSCVLHIGLFTDNILEGNGHTNQFHPREDRAGLQIDDDNAQAMLPPNACVFVAK